jgi:hypothetical protein
MFCSRKASSSAYFGIVDQSFLVQKNFFEKNISKHFSFCSRFSPICERSNSFCPFNDYKKEEMAMEYG